MRRTSRSPSRPRTCSRRSSARASRPRARPEGTWPCSTTNARERARSTSSSSSGSRRVPSRVGTGRHRSSATSSGDELGGRLERPDTVARDRYLFYTTCTRAAHRLVLVREAASDEGVPREPSPFWEDVRSLFTEAERAARDAAPVAVGVDVAARIGAERARATAGARSPRGRRPGRRIVTRGGERLVAPARLARARRSIARRRCEARLRSVRSRRRRSSRRQSWSASRTARPRGSSNASSIRRRSMPSRTRCFAVRFCTRR